MSCDFGLNFSNHKAEETAYLGLGSNEGDRVANIREAIRRLENGGSCRVIDCSSVYETKPVGIIEQPDFLNAVVRVTTSLTPLALLDYCQAIEHSMGRVRTMRWGPRVIDIDILLYGRESLCTERLVIPHPEMLKRAFVLVPLSEIAPSIELTPGITATEAAERLDRAGVRYFGRLD